MRIQKILELEGIKIIDTNILYPEDNLVEIVTSGDNTQLKKAAKCLRATSSLFSAYEVFFVDETVRDYGKFLGALVGCSDKIHERYPGWEQSRRTRRKVSNPNPGRIKGIEKIVRAAFSLYILLKGKKVDGFFSPQERAAYYSLFGKLKKLTERFQLKSTGSRKDHYTEEQIAAALLTASKRMPAIAISRDIDIPKILRHPIILPPEKRVYVYADTSFNQEYKQVYP
jgi:hypothetical protein